MRWDSAASVIAGAPLASPNGTAIRIDGTAPSIAGRPNDCHVLARWFGGVPGANSPDLAKRTDRGIKRSNFGVIGLEPEVMSGNNEGGARSHKWCRLSDSN